MCWGRRFLGAWGDEGFVLGKMKGRTEYIVFVLLLVFRCAQRVLERKKMVCG